MRKDQLKWIVEWNNEWQKQFADKRRKRLEEILVKFDSPGRTHWKGCEEFHALCALRRELESLFEGFVSW